MSIEKVLITFHKKYIISSTTVPNKKWNEKKNTYELVVDTNGDPEHIQQTKIKLPLTSQYRGYLLTTTEPLRYRETICAIWLNQNTKYMISRTPYVVDEKGQIIIDQDGQKKLNLAEQKIKKLTGNELKKEFDFWKRDFAILKHGEKSRKMKGGDRN